MIFCANPKAQYLPYKEEIDAAVLKVLDSGSYILGEQVSLFEEEFAAYLSVDFAVGCGSGTDALVLALKALDIGAGDEVIVPSFIATPTVAAVVMEGAIPVYADIEPDYYTIDPACVEAACTERTRAIIAVHLYGQAAAMDELMGIAVRRNLRLIEDCAQATGATYHEKKLGTIGDIGCFSFFPTKNLGAIGDGGALVCSDESLAMRLRGLRQYGWDKNRVSLESGINSRLDELQAAVLRAKLKHLDADNAARRSQAEYYDGALAALDMIPTVRNGAEHMYHLYVIHTKNRDELVRHFARSDIHVGVHYPVPVHKMPAYRTALHLPVTERLADEVLSIPLYPGMSETSQEDIITSFLSFRGKQQ